jgi:hypothetical protein
LRRAITLLLVLILFVQQRTAAQRPPTSAAATIVVQPSQEGIQISALIINQVTSADLRAQFSQLSGELGGTLVSFSAGKGESPPGIANRNTSTVEAAAVVQCGPIYRDHAFLLRPFVRLAGVHRSADVLFVWPRDPAFQGTVLHQNSGLKVELKQDGAPFRYRIECTDSKALSQPIPDRRPSPQLPQSQAAPARARFRLLGILLMLCAGAGIAGLLGIIILRSGRRPEL